MDLKYVLKTFVYIFLIFSLILFVNSLFIIEGFTTSILLDKGASFCESHRGSSAKLNESCGNLTETNCNSTSCCNWTSANKCVAGTQTGPTFNTDSNGKTKQLDYYYFQNKCYGPKCPQNE